MREIILALSAIGFLVVWILRITELDENEKRILARNIDISIIPIEFAIAIYMLLKEL